MARLERPAGPAPARAARRLPAAGHGKVSSNGVRGEWAVARCRCRPRRAARTSFPRCSKRFSAPLSPAGPAAALTYNAVTRVRSNGSPRVATARTRPVPGVGGASGGPGGGPRRREGRAKAARRRAAHGRATQAVSHSRATHRYENRPRYGYRISAIDSPPTAVLSLIVQSTVPPD